MARSMIDAMDDLKCRQWEAMKQFPDQVSLYKMREEHFSVILHSLRAVGYRRLLSMMNDISQE